MQYLDQEDRDLLNKHKVELGTMLDKLMEFGHRLSSLAKIIEEEFDFLISKNMRSHDVLSLQVQMVKQLLDHSNEMFGLTSQIATRSHHYLDGIEKHIKKQPVTSSELQVIQEIVSGHSNFLTNCENTYNQAHQKYRAFLTTFLAFGIFITNARANNIQAAYNVSLDEIFQELLGW